MLGGQNPPFLPDAMPEQSSNGSRSRLVHPSTGMPSLPLDATTAKEGGGLPTVEGESMGRWASSQGTHATEPANMTAAAAAAGTSQRSLAVGRPATSALDQPPMTQSPRMCWSRFDGIPCICVKVDMGDSSGLMA